MSMPTKPPILSRLLVAALLLFAAVRAARAAEPPPPLPSGTCDLPADFSAHAAALPHAAAAAQAGQLEVLAIGSATPQRETGGNVGSDAAGDEESIPGQATAMLRAALPGAAVRLVLNVHRAAAATDLLAALRGELAHHSYPLVLWQTGTVEAARRLPPAEFERVLRDGARLVAAAGGDLVLIDPQFSRMLESKADPLPYEAAFSAVARQPAVALFSRYSLIQHWIERGQLDLEHAARKDRRHDMDLLHACVARGLAQTILAGIESARK